MASRKEQKEQLRAEREAREKAELAAKLKRQRLTMVGGVVIIAVVVAVVAIAISSHHGKPTNSAEAADVNSAQTKATDARVEALLAGIPQQSDNVLGNPSAPVTITEYGDLECSVCDSFALPTDINTSAGEPGSGVLDQIIENLVKTGKAKLVYRSLDTETSGGATPNEFVPQQAAAYAAGLQKKAWNYIELFYNEQGEEGTDYVDTTYLTGIAKQIPGLNLAQWQKDMNSSTLKNQVTSDISAGQAAHATGTPTILVTGAKGTQLVASGVPTYAEVASAVQAIQ